MKNYRIIGVMSLFVLGIIACTSEVETERGTSLRKPQTGTTEKTADQQAEETADTCDNPQLYGPDCTGDHPDEGDEVLPPVKQQPAPVENEPEEKPADPAPTTPPADPNIVTFAIPAGTGTKSYNDQATMVKTKVGQTLKVTNNDSVVHQIHTGGKPFGHGSPIQPGQTVEYKIQSAVDPGTNPPTYDHIAGSSAKFWLKADP